MLDAHSEDYRDSPTETAPEICRVLPDSRRVAVMSDAGRVRRCRIDPQARHRGAVRGSHVAAKRRREEAQDWAEDFFPWIIASRAEGKSLAEIAEELTADGLETRKGKIRWHPAQVQRILRRALERADEILEDLQGQIDDLRRVLALERRASIKKAKHA